MALSNLRREPRREITEQVVGVLLFAALVGCDYAFVSWLAFSKTEDFIIGIVFFPVFFFGAVFGAWLLLAHGIHLLGEIGCSLLAAVGADPRPKQRR